MTVQWVNRPSPDFHGFSGRISSGTVKPGDAVRIVPSGSASTVARIVSGAGDLECAVAGQSVTLTIADQVECERGDVICEAREPVQAADHFQARLVVLDRAVRLPGRPLWLKIGARTVAASIEEKAAGVVELTTDRQLPYEPHAENRELGGFILIDKATHVTVATGMILGAVRKAENVHWHALEVTREQRARAKQQRAAVLWLTGLSGSGKSTVANLVEKKLASMHLHTFLLDGDNVRHGLNSDLGFSAADRAENIRRVAEVAKLMTDAGLIVITSFISPFRAERQLARQRMRPGEFFEVFVDTPLAAAEARDAKGLYKKARAGLLQDLTGVDSPYEAPENPDLRIDTTSMSLEHAADAVIGLLDLRARSL